jgi:hypothetical protein
VRPLSAVRARWLLLVLEEDRAYRTIVRPVARRESGRDLLTRLGAPLDRSRGVIRCPAHEDRSPSLSWRLADDGRALVHCFSGCDFEAIVEAIA